MIRGIFVSSYFLSNRLNRKAMKKILLISIALLFGCTLFAQSPIDYPKYPYATYKCAQMIPDYNELPPWAVFNQAQMVPDCFPPSCYAKSKNQPTPFVEEPGYPVTKYKREMMKPDHPSYPSNPCEPRPLVRFD